MPSVSTGSGERKPLRVLICESNQRSEILLRRLLELRGHLPVVVTLERALAMIDEHACDRLLIDTHLIPPMSNLATSVIGLTSSPERETEAACRAAGISTWISKPVLATELWAALDDGLA